MFCKKSVLFLFNIQNFLEFSVINLCKILLFKKIDKEFMLVFQQTFPCNIENFPCTFNITCNQKLSGLYNLFISRTFLLWLPESFIYGIFYFSQYILIYKKNYSFSRVVFLFLSDQNCQLFLFKNKWQQYGLDNSVLKQWVHGSSLCRAKYFYDLSLAFFDARN